MDENVLDQVAIIGMTCRFPGAKNVDQFWRNLRDGVESVSFFSDEQLEAGGVDAALLNDPSYVKARPVLEDMELFDASFFRVAPIDAELLDPQQRLFLECAWAALESAGYDPGTFGGRVGVYAGVDANTYLLNNLLSNQGCLAAVSGLQNVTNDKDYLSTRVSYKLNLRGPSITVQTACSTSLVAVHLACESLLNCECDMALAGGASIRVPQKTGYLYQEGGIESPDGHCRAFDARAQGTVFGSGVGIVVLRRLVDALADGDGIHAVIRGSAVNNDGSLKIGYTAPSVDGQATVISEALKMAGVEPESITYVEAHGTGTRLGDPIEIAALTRAFRRIRPEQRTRPEQRRTAKVGFCAIGSVKTNVGHLSTAAGCASLIKTVLALKHKEIPPSLHFERPNPEIDLQGSPFYVNTALCPWQPDSVPRRAGVSSFGLGGTNAHVILEEAPRSEAARESRSHQLVVLSARSERALEQMTDNLVDHLVANPNLELADVAYTLHVGRRAFQHRRMLVCRGLGDAVSALKARDAGRVLTGFCEAGGGGQKLAFMFPGLGDQYVNMTRGLYRGEAVYREVVDACSEMLLPHLGFDLCHAIFPDSPLPRPLSQTRERGVGSLPQDWGRVGAGAGLSLARFPDGGQEQGVETFADQGVDLCGMLGRNHDEGEPLAAKLGQTHVAQLALFVIEYALARTWMSWGIVPQALIGYSLGEYVAACLAGVFSLQEGLQVVLQRARMIEALPESAMLAIALPAGEVTPLLDDTLSLSAINGPQMCVVSGLPEDVARLDRGLTVEGIACRRLKVSHAGHSKVAEPMMEGFREFMRRVELRPPEIPYVSNVTGTWVTPEQATDPDHWVAHIRQPIRFADGVQVLCQEGYHALLEAGIGQTLGSLALQRLDKGGALDLVLSSIPSTYDKQPELALLMRSLGRLWLAGVPVDWPGFYAHEHRVRCALPTYPFERQRYWVDPSPPCPASLPATEKKSDMADWFYVPSWRRVPLANPNREMLQGRAWLFFVDGSGLGTSLVDRLRRQVSRCKRDLLVVMAGESFRRVRDDVYTIDPRAGDDYAALIEHLVLANKPPERIVHLWSVPESDESSLEKAAARVQQLGFGSLLFLAQALGRQRDLEPVHIWTISSGMHDVLGGERIRPEQALLLGPCKVIPKEVEQVTCSSIDVASSTAHREAVVEQLAAELTADARDPVVAYRGPSRWVQSFEPIRLEGPVGPSRVKRQESNVKSQIEEPDRGGVRLREGGVYLITGGLGGLGSALAKQLAHKVQARLVLVGRSGLPPREDWSAWGGHDERDEQVCRRIQLVLDLEALGAKVLAATADVADRAQMQQVLDRTHERFGCVNGVFHLAGVPGEGTIQFKTAEMAARVLAPKLQGTLVLNAVLRNEPLDFLVLYSSSSAITGRLGEVDYCAGNAFLDAYAPYHRRERSIPTVSIDWGPWQWDAWEERLSSSVPQIYERAKRMRKRVGITFAEGDEALWRILATSLPQVLVLTQDLQVMLDESHLLTLANLVEQIQGAYPEQGEGWASRRAYPRPNLRTPYVPPRNEREEKIARIWAESLAVDKVGIHDHFFELGGNSLIGLVIVSRLEKELGTKLSAAILYEGPTVSTLYSSLYQEEEKESSFARDRDRGTLRRELRRRRERK